MRSTTNTLIVWREELAALQAAREDIGRALSYELQKAMERKEMWLEEQIRVTTEWFERQETTVAQLASSTDSRVA